MIVSFITQLGKIMTFKEAHTQTLESVSGKRDFADVIKVKDFEIGILFWILQMSSV